MKNRIRELKLGESVTGRVEELLPASDLLICINGDLLIVHNETRKPFRVGDFVTLQVCATQPLKFRFIEDRSEQRRRGHLDLSV